MAQGWEKPETEYGFDPERRWRFDFAWPRQKIAVEIEGILWQGAGRHQRAAGYSRDCEKYNSALMLGWKVLRYTPDQCMTQIAAVQIGKLLYEGAPE